MSMAYYVRVSNLPGAGGKQTRFDSTMPYNPCLVLSWTWIILDGDESSYWLVRNSTRAWKWHVMNNCICTVRIESVQLKTNWVSRGAPTHSTTDIQHDTSIYSIQFNLSHTNPIILFPPDFFSLFLIISVSRNPSLFVPEWPTLADCSINIELGGTFQYPTANYNSTRSSITWKGLSDRHDCFRALHELTNERPDGRTQQIIDWNKQRTLSPSMS